MKKRQKRAYGGTPISISDPSEAIVRGNIAQAKKQYEIDRKYAPWEQAAGVVSSLAGSIVGGIVQNKLDKLGNLQDTEVTQNFSSGLNYNPNDFKLNTPSLPSYNEDSPLIKDFRTSMLRDQYLKGFGQNQDLGFKAPQSNPSLLDPNYKPFGYNQTMPSFGGFAFGGTVDPTKPQRPGSRIYRQQTADEIAAGNTSMRNAYNNGLGIQLDNSVASPLQHDPTALVSDGYIKPDAFIHDPRYKGRYNASVAGDGTVTITGTDRIFYGNRNNTDNMINRLIELNKGTNLRIDPDASYRATNAYFNAQKRGWGGTIAKGLGLAMKALPYAQAIMPVIESFTNEPEDPFEDFYKPKFSDNLRFASGGEVPPPPKKRRSLMGGMFASEDDIRQNTNDYVNYITNPNEDFQSAMDKRLGAKLHYNRGSKFDKTLGEIIKQGNSGHNAGDINATSYYPFNDFERQAAKEYLASYGSIPDFEENSFSIGHDNRKAYKDFINHVRERAKKLERIDSINKKINPETTASSVAYPTNRMNTDIMDTVKKFSKLKPKFDDISYGSTTYNNGVIDSDGLSPNPNRTYGYNSQEVFLPRLKKDIDYAVEDEKETRSWMGKDTTGLDYNNVNYKTHGYRGHKYATGGNVNQQIPIEAEGQEVVEEPNGNMYELQGASHEQGGIDMNVPEGSQIYSKRLKGMDGKTMADRKKFREQHLAKLQRLMELNPNDRMLKKTYEKTVRDFQKQEEEDLAYMNYMHQQQEMAQQQQAIQQQQMAQAMQQSAYGEGMEEGYQQGYGQGENMGYSEGMEEAYEEQPQFASGGYVNPYENRNPFF